MNTLLNHRVEAGNALGFRLLSLLTAGDDAAKQNVFLSSFSIALALAMTFY